MSTVYNFQYRAASGNVYSGQVATDASTPYSYQPGQQIPYNGGTYVIGTESYQSNVPAGTVYCTNYYDAATNRNYDSYHYDPAHNQYYNVTQNSYDQATGTYQGVSMAAGTGGLGSEYDYARGPDGQYHVYGGGGYAHAQITPSTTGTHDYDYRFTYADGSYYTGRVTDDGSFGYTSGYTRTTPYGTYTITGVEATPPSANELAGYTYTNSYYDAGTGQTYNTYTPPPTSEYYNRPNGYHGLGSEVGYAQYANGYHAYGYGGAQEASTTPAISGPPPLT